jgi:hypothetical protein
MQVYTAYLDFINNIEEACRYNGTLSFRPKLIFSRKLCPSTVPFGPVCLATRTITRSSEQVSQQRIISIECK